MSRQIVWRNYFEALDYGVAGTDNPAAMFWSSSGGVSDPRRHIAVVQSTFDGMAAGVSNGVAATDSYNIRYGVWEHNVLKNCSSLYGLWLKGGHQDVSVRFNVGVENNVSSSGVFNIYGSSDGSSINFERVETCYNKGIEGGTGEVFSMNVASASTDNVEVWAYRNTMKGGTNIRVVGSLVEGNIATDSDLVSNFGASNVTVTGVEIDANGNLAGAARTSYLGTHGAEIA